MRSSILLLALAATILGGCASAYKTGQTPDDVYFSPGRQHDEYVNVKDQSDDQYNNNDDQYYGDEYLRMRVHNRAVWSELDDPYFYNPVYSYGYSYSNSWYWNNPWNPYTYWNCSYNPYYNSYYPVIIGSKTSFAYNHPRVFNLNTYNPNLVSRTGSNSYLHGMNNNGYNNYNNSYNRPVRIGASNSNSNVNSNTGNFLRNVFNNSSNNSSNSSSGNAGRSSSSSSSSSGSSGSSGGSAPVRKF